MPELPEVQTVVDTLRPWVGGKKILEVRLGLHDVLEPRGTDLRRNLLGRTIRSIERRGKRIVIALDDSNRFYVHLGMSGRLTMHGPSDPVMPHTHVVFVVESALPEIQNLELRFRDPRRFGGVWWLGDGPHDDGMGPEPLSVRPAQLIERLGKTGRAIKSALLDQTVIAGLGNIYVDEALFAAGIHPLAPADRLDAAQVGRLNRAIKMVLRRAIAGKGSTLRDYRDANGNAGMFQTMHRVYGRQGKPCVKCARPVNRIVLGGRSTHFCANCQPKAKR